MIFISLSSTIHSKQLDPTKPVVLQIVWSYCHYSEIQITNIWLKLGIFVVGCINNYRDLE
jgi:hypothetical protein